MLRKTLSFVLVLALALSLVGCGGAASSSTPASISTTSTNSASGNVDGSDAEPVTLHVLANSTALPENMFDFLVEGYMEHFPNVTVELEVVSQNDFLAKFSSLMAAEQIPDIIYGGAPVEYIEGGKVQELSEFVKTSALDQDCTVEESVIDGSLDACRSMGGLWSVPQNPGFAGIVINETMFEEHGWKIPDTWEELLAVSEEIIADGITPISYAALNNETRVEMCIMESLCYTNGGKDFMDARDNLDPEAWNSEAQVESFRMLKELVDRGIIDKKGLSMDATQSQVAFLQGQYAMCASGYWFESEMQDQIGDLKLGYMAFPANKGDDKTKEVNTWYNAWSAMKSGDEAREAAALDFLRWIVSYEFQKAYVTDGGSTTSSNRKVMEEMAKDTNLSYFSQQVASTLADPNLTAYDSKYTTWYAQSFRVPEYTSIIYNVIAGDYTPEEAGEACAALAQKILDDDSIMKYTK